MAYGLVPLINGKSYEWADITFNLFGLPFAGVTKINYDDPQNMKNVKGSGNRVVSRIYGDFDPEASISLLMEEVENILSVAPKRIIQNIPEFNITVTYTDPTAVTRIHILRNCRFMNNPRGSERGTGEIECEMKLIISHVEYIS